MIDLVILFFIVSTIGMLAIVAWSAIQNKRSPIVRVPAVVLRRRTREDNIDGPSNPFPLLISVLGRRIGWSGRFQDHDKISVEHMARLSGEVTLVESVNHFITFGVQSDELELLVPEGVFMSLQDGERGTLVYQGEVFKHFMRNS